MYRADPDPVNHGRRAAIRKLLIAESRMSPAAADEWMARWDAHARRQGIQPSPGYWKIGLVWMNEQLDRS